MGRRKRMDRRQTRRGQAPSFTRYKMQQQLIAIGKDFWIENEQGQKVFRVDGKALRIRDTLLFKDPQGNELCRIQEKKLRIRDTMEIEGPDGQVLAKVKKAIITPLRDRWTVKIGSGPDLEIQGNILDHEYRIGEGRQKVGEVSKKWFRVRDMYGVEVAEGHSDVLILAVVVAVDMMR